jgi:Zn-finger nucleic acid-binding protein
MHGCPRDEVRLVPHAASGVAVHRCGTCAGVWVPPSVVGAAVGSLRPPESHSITSLRCPDDGNPLVAVHHRGVEVDFCTACGGVWLDHGELERILRSNKTTSALVEVAGNGATNVDVFCAAGELAGEAVKVVVEFLADALSGL